MTKIEAEFQRVRWRVDAPNAAKALAEAINGAIDQSGSESGRNSMHVVKRD